VQVQQEISENKSLYFNILSGFTENNSRKTRKARISLLRVFASFPRYGLTEAETRRDGLGDGLGRRKGSGAAEEIWQHRVICVSGFLKIWILKGYVGGLVHFEDRTFAYQLLRLRSMIVVSASLFGGFCCFDNRSTTDRR